MEKVLNVYFDDFITVKILGYVKDIEKEEKWRNRYTALDIMNDLRFHYIREDIKNWRRNISRGNIIYYTSCARKIRFLTKREIEPYHYAYVLKNYKMIKSGDPHIFETLLYLIKDLSKYFNKYY